VGEEYSASVIGNVMSLQTDSKTDMAKLIDTFLQHLAASVLKKKRKTNFTSQIRYI
jgi:hypothetical protein